MMHRLYSPALESFLTSMGCMDCGVAIMSYSEHFYFKRTMAAGQLTVQQQLSAWQRTPWCIAPIHTSLGGVQEIGVPFTHPEGTWTPLHMRVTATVTTSLTPKAILLGLNCRMA